MTPTFKKIQPVLLAIAGIKAPYLFALFFGLNIFSLLELYFSNQNFSYVIANLSILVTLTWQVSVGTLLFLKNNTQVKATYIFFIIGLLAFPVQLILTNLVAKELLLASSQPFRYELTQFYTFIRFLVSLAIIYVPYFLAKNLNSAEAIHKKVDSKTFIYFFLLIFGIWNLEPRIHNVLFPQHVVKPYSRKIKWLVVASLLIYFMTLIGIGIARTEKYTQEYKQMSQTQ